MTGRAEFPVFPPVAAAALRAVPLSLMHLPLSRLMAGCLRRHPALFTRLGRHAAATFLIDPSDLPVAFRLRPSPHAPCVEALRKPIGAPWDARIAGPLAALLGMIHGRLDGDALFFSGDILFEGDTEAILALRNALDDAEIDMAAEVAAALGPLRAIVEGPARRALPIVERLTGVALSRAGTGST